MKGNYAGKNRNSSASTTKIHFVKNGKRVCNVFQMVPNHSEDKTKANCINCQKWIEENK